MESYQEFIYKALENYKGKRPSKLDMFCAYTFFNSFNITELEALELSIKSK